MAQLRAQGHTVVIYSARSWSELRMTEQWLADHDIPYDGIHLGKPVAERLLDDRAVRFTGWDTALADLARPGQAVDPDELYLRILRNETKSFIRAIADRADLLEPVLEVGPMTRDSAVFQRMPETFLDSRALFQGKGLAYRSLDLDPDCGADCTGDFADADTFLEPDSIGTAVLVSCIEHMPRLWEVPRILRRILKPGGLAFMLTPWNLRFHGPRPDCWRISDDGYTALFADGFRILSMEQIPCPGRPLSPVGITCVVQRLA
jgi:SAM-dependent methyltransferase